MSLGLMLVRGESKTVYAELLGYQKGLFSRKVTVTVDFGQAVSFWRSNRDTKLVDDNGKDIVFNSMVDAMNFMGERGWHFMQAYVITEGNQNVYHWLLSKDIKDGESITDGFRTRKMSKEEQLEAEIASSYKITYMRRSLDSSEWEVVSEEVKEGVTEKEATLIARRWKNKAGGQWVHDCRVEPVLE